MIDTIMLFAAGKGTRMKHLTKNKPKCLIEICGKAVLYHLLDICLSHGFKKIVINVHYLSEQIIASIEKYKKIIAKLPEIIIIHENELLETGGAVKNASAILGNEPIFILNSDVILKSDRDIFDYVLSKWDGNKMDFLLLLQPYNKAVGYKSSGDFELKPTGEVSRIKNNEKYSFVYSGLAILKPDKIAENNKDRFSLKEYYLSANKVFGVVVQNMEWYHASNPENITEIENVLQFNSKST